MISTYFLGGLGSHSYSSLDFIEQLPFPVTVIDLPGHGSEQDVVVSNTSQLLDWFAQKIDDKQPCILIGHSLGASLIAYLASQCPNVKSVILLDGAYIEVDKLISLDDELAETARFLETSTYPDIESAIQAEKQMSSKWTDNQQKAIEKSLIWKEGSYRLNVNAESVFGLISLHHQIVPSLEGITCPCLLLPQTKDLPTWKWHMLNKVPDHIQIQKIPDCGHHLHIEKPKLIAQVVSRFLFPIQQRP